MGTLPGVGVGPPVRPELEGSSAGDAHADVQSPPPSAAQPLTQAAQPTHSFPVFRSGDGAFTVEYPPRARLDRSGVSWTYKGGHVQFFSMPARSRTAPEIAETVIQKHYPGATVDYAIPNAMVGYQPGYGEFDDVYTTQSGSASYRHLRVLAMVAIKNGLALIAFAAGPYHRFTPAEISHPSGADLEIANRMGPFVNSFRWAGDPPG